MAMMEEIFSAPMAERKTADRERPTAKQRWSSLLSKLKEEQLSVAEFGGDTENWASLGIYSDEGEDIASVPTAPPDEPTPIGAPGEVEAPPPPPPDEGDEAEGQGGKEGEGEEREVKSRRLEEPRPSLARSPHFHDRRLAQEKENVLQTVQFGPNTTFVEIMENRAGLAAFTEFLRLEYAEENIKFWSLAERFFALGDSVEEQCELVRTIMTRHIGVESENPVNLPGDIVQQLQEVYDAHKDTEDKADLVNAVSFCMHEAKQEISTLVKRDNFRRFKQSPQFANLIEECKRGGLVRVKVLKFNKYNKNSMRILEFDEQTGTLTFFKAEGGRDAETRVIGRQCLHSVHQSEGKKGHASMKIVYFTSDRRLLRHQKELRIQFRSAFERERMARLLRPLLLTEKREDHSRSSFLYQPTPLEISQEVKQQVEELPIQRLAAVLHEAWCQSKRETGWVYGPVLSEEKKTDPSLVDFKALTQSEREYDLGISRLSCASILELGYCIQEMSRPVIGVNDNNLSLLVEFLAENAHEAWAANKFRRGWTYGSVRDEQAKTHPLLVPYIDLRSSDQDMDRKAASKILSSLCEWGFDISLEY